MITPKKAKSIILSPEEGEITCRLCNKPAMCNKFICYKKKQGAADCANCDERLCTHHWRIYFRNNI